MSRVLPHRNVKPGAATQRTYGSQVKAIDFGDGTVRPQVRLDDGRTGPGCCLACSSPPCLERLASPSAASTILSQFPQDPSDELCPTNAITFTDGIAVIDVDACIGCGLCVMRCPYGAIHLTTDGKASIAQDDPGGLTRPEADVIQGDVAIRKGRLGATRSLALSKLQDYVGRLSDTAQLRFVANMFSFVGVDARVRRRGDTNIRFDGLLGFPNGSIGVMEAEFSGNAVESPRALLEDVAILHSRYNVPINQLYPVSVLLALPNARSEYYQVMQDIDAVLGIKCRTITIGALMAMVWNLAELTHLDKRFLTTPGGADLGPTVKDVTGLSQREPYPGAFVTAK